jgi:hypothetical protein
MNPQDLLYTNEFTEKYDGKRYNDNDKRDENYYRYTNYVASTPNNETNEYIITDNYENDPVNINKRLNTKFPIYRNRNHYPLFDPFINDVSVNQYQKVIETKINLDSTLRDRTISQYPNDFVLNLPQVFTNVSKIVINDINIPNITQSINEYNNNICWQYPTKTYLLENNLYNTIIPTTDKLKQINYLTLPNVVSNLSDENILVYQENITNGNYSIKSFIERFKYQTGKIYHGDLSVNNSTKNQNDYIVEAPYFSYNEFIRTPHLFSVNINPTTNIVKFVNRMEELKVISIQTFSQYTTDFENNDIYYNYSDTKKTIDTKYIYVLLKSENNITSAYYSDVSGFPLVFTGIDINIGNINYDIFNYNEFYDLNIYLTNNYTEDEIKSVPTYKYWDTITINNIKYIRFAFKVTSGNILNFYNPNGNIYIPVTTQTLVFNNNIYNIFKENDIEYYDKTFLVGRALLYRWIFDKNNKDYLPYEILSENVKKRSVLNILSWPIPVETYNQILATQNKGFAFVQQNNYGTILNYNSNELNSNLADIILYGDITNPSNLNIQYYGEDYYFITPGYIYLKIDFSTSSSNNNFVENPLQIGNNSINQQYSQNYIFNNFIAGIGDQSICVFGNNNINNSLSRFTNLFKKDSTNIFSKIQISNIPNSIDNTVSNINLNNVFSVNYTSPIDNLYSIRITLYDSDFKLINNTRDFNFTMIVSEVKDVLKETLVDTKRNTVHITGKR